MPGSLFEQYTEDFQHITAGTVSHTPLSFLNHPTGPIAFPKLLLAAFASQALGVPNPRAPAGSCNCPPNLVRTRAPTVFATTSPATNTLL